MANLRTVIRVTMVVGAGLVLAPLLMLLDPDQSAAPDFFAAGMRLQIAFGCFVLLIGFALWRRQSWARVAALWLLRVGACAAVGWSIYGAFEIARMASISGLLVAMLLVITAFWLITFKKGIAYLNQPSVVAELEGGVQ